MQTAPFDLHQGEVYNAFWISVITLFRTGALTPIIHIVDDERAVRNAIARLLQVTGYDVAVYESGKQLLDQLPAIRQPSCILIDMLMPGVNGLAVQDHLEKVGSTLPILFMTGSEKEIQSGPKEFLLKPFSKEELLNAIERALKPNGRRERAPAVL